MLITGTRTGIGRSLAEHYAQLGYTVVGCSRSGIEEPPAGYYHFCLDVADEKAVTAMFAEIRKSIGRLDVLVNNAGIAGPTKRIEDVTPEEVEETLRVDLAAMFHTARRAVPALRAAGGGAIINLSSAAGRFGFKMRSPYAAAKWGVVGLTKTLAVELGADGISVNAILPGLVDGPRVRAILKAKAEAAGIGENAQTDAALATVSLRCFVTQQDITNMALYLASPFGRTISGQALAIDGDM